VKTTLQRDKWMILGPMFLMLAGLPLLGVVLSGQHLASYLEFPPTTQYVEHAPFSWGVFAIMLIGVVLVVLPFVAWDRLHAFLDDEAVPSIKGFPWWGWAGFVFGIVAWALAWSRFEWCSDIQPHLFTPQWLSYIIVVNALTYRKTGQCMLTHRTGYFFTLFLASAVFWWFFEYLNRFVQNWHYDGVDNVSPSQYFWRATLPFSTVLPAVLGTCDLLAGGTRLFKGLEGFLPVRLRNPKYLAGGCLVLACIGLAGIGVWPDLLYPLLWIAPLLIITSIQAIGGQRTIFAPLKDGNWRRICLLALSALICGFFWEMWNSKSSAKWIYTVPFVNRFKIFEMPLLGYAGYLPFGLECAVIGDLVKEWTCKNPRIASSRARLAATAAVALVISAFIWLPFLHLCFKPDVNDYRSREGIAPKAGAIAAQQFHLWDEQGMRNVEVARMRVSNAEWDFMGRTFHVLALANMALREPGQRKLYLGIMDRIIDDTLRLERENGIYYFLMDYARDGQFVSSRARSLFQDGEIAMMLGCRRLIDEKASYREPFSFRIGVMKACMQESPVLAGESYPDECWMFCNTVALAAMRISDVLDNTNHEEFFKRWLSTARSNLIDPATGLLISSFSSNGHPFDGPEGSSIWMSAHCLQLVDPEFAAEQYRIARDLLGNSFLGFGFAREWPDSWKGPIDVDSGPVIPILQISAGSSGLAILGASAFGDDTYLSRLLTSLNFGGFPISTDGRLKFAASNQVGDAVLLYALVVGPLWKEIWNRA